MEAETKKRPSRAKPPVKVREQVIDLRNPSEVTDEPWVHIRKVNSEYPAHTPRGGKWMVFQLPETMDILWPKIRQAVLDGKLGREAKVSTAYESPLRISNDLVACIYTYDSEDRADVMKIRSVLASMGVTWAISYKCNQQTRDGEYSHLGATKISRYRV